MDGWQQDRRQSGSSNTSEGNISGDNVHDSRCGGVRGIDGVGNVRRSGSGQQGGDREDTGTGTSAAAVLDRREASETDDRRLMWVKGHDRVEGNEQADSRAKQEVWIGERMHWPDIVTPAGIRQAYPLTTRQGTDTSELA